MAAADPAVNTFEGLREREEWSEAEPRSREQILWPRKCSQPSGTYRVQVRPDFDFTATAAIADYLAAVGASHLYSAPMLQSMPGSAHGYDVADPRQVNSQLGGEDGRQVLLRALRARKLGLIADIVPNHVGVRVPDANPAWWDVLCFGQESDYADWFDIDWASGRVKLPVLGDDSALEDLRIENGELRYFEHKFPIADGTEHGTPQEIHDRQHYELISWRRGNSEINYRRFFAVNDLAAVRVEDPAVFEETHSEILRWYEAGDIDGIRVDHPDGLRDPGDYLERLRQHAPDAWIVAEKITEPGEDMPAWPIAGTTGYDALRETCGVFIDTSAEDAFTALDTEFTGVTVDYAELIHDCKLEVVTDMLRAELNRLARLATTEEPALDVERTTAALAELIACFDVYRSYLPFGAEHLEFAAAEAADLRPDLRETFDALFPRLGDPSDELAVRFQQVSGAAMAKGVEDTAFYRWTRFTALNEVGGDPQEFGVTVDAFHAAAAGRHERWPAGMTTLSTHDTKRGEDVRARLAVLSEIPDEWADTVRGWKNLAPLDDGAIAHLLWQTVAGAWPLDRDRLHAYLEKAAREARTITSWDDPEPEFEADLHFVIDQIYDDPALRLAVDSFVERITPHGWSNSLGQKLLQLAGPGIPDVYQGTELWENSLVDPDNRRPVDFDLLREILARIDSGWQPAIGPDGAAKLLVTTRALRLRRDHPDLFSGYSPVSANGSAADHLIGFDRGGVLAVATRLPVGLARLGGWADTAVDLDGNWTDSLTGARWAGEVKVSALLSVYPVALLVR